MKEEKKTELEKRVELLEKVVIALCRWKKDNIHEGWVSTWVLDWKTQWLVNEFEKEMKDLDFNYLE